MTEYQATTEHRIETGTAHSIHEWRAIAPNRFVPLRVRTRTAADTFEGTLRFREVDRVSIGEITANTHTVERTSDLISRREPQHFKLSLQLDGTGYVAQDGRDAFLRPGDIAIYDTGRPYTLDFTDDTRCLVMAFPADAFEIPRTLIRRITAVRLAGDAGVGSVISPFMQHMAENLDLLDGAHGDRITRSSLDLLTTLVYAELAGGDLAEGASRQAEMRTFTTYIEENLGDPDLSAASIAREHFVSVRHLQYRFQDEDLTVSGYIRARRLEHCRRDLSEPSLAHQSVSHIAQRWGFADASHFSKIFKGRFDVSPREYRGLHVSP